MAKSTVIIRKAMANSRSHALWTAMTPASNEAVKRAAARRSSNAAAWRSFLAKHPKKG